MKWLYNTCLLLLLSMIFAACQVPGGLNAGDVAGAVRDGVVTGITVADRNGDGMLTNRELKDAKNDPNLWIALAGGILGLFGAVKGSKAQKDADELYDRVHPPAGAPKA